jgi:hypothetical protein
MSLPTSLSSGLISDSARGTPRARPDLELRSAAAISRVPLRSRGEHPANAPVRPALRGKPNPLATALTIVVVRPFHARPMS